MGTSKTSTTLVGREAELETLHRLLAELNEGRGGCVWVEGEAGIGKSALLRAMAGRAETVGLPVYRANFDALSHRIPLSALFEAFSLAPPSPEVPRDASGFAASLSAGRDPVAAGIESVLGEVDRLCSNGPVVLVAEDVHWADEAGLLVIQRLCRTTAQLPLLVACSARAVPGRQEVGRVRRSIGQAGGSVMEIGGLAPAEVADLASRLVGGMPDTHLAERLHAAGGNPLFVRELLDALLRAGSVDVGLGGARLRTEESGKTAAAARPEPPASLLAAIEDRLRLLSGDAREALNTAALLGAVFSISDVAEIRGCSAGSLARAIQEAIAVGVLEAEGLRLRFRHELLRQVLHESVPPSRRSLLHRDAARALIEAGAAPERVARVVIGGLDVADGWEIDWIAENAAVICLRAPELAHRLVEHAVSRTVIGDPRRAGLLRVLADACLHLNRVRQALEATLATLEEVRDPEERGRAFWIGASAQLRALEPQEADRLIDDGLAEPGMPGLWRARLVSVKAIAAWNLGRYDEVRRLATRAIADGERIGDPVTIANSRYFLALADSMSSSPSAYIADLDEVLRSAASDPSMLNLTLQAYINKISALCAADRFKEADACVKEVRELTRRGARQRIAYFAFAVAELAFNQGSWDDALTEIEAGYDPSDFVGEMDQIEPFVAHSLAALIAAHRDERDAVERHLAFLPSLDSTVTMVRINSIFALLAQAESAQAASDAEGALAILKVVIEPEYDGIESLSLALPVLMRLALSTGDLATAKSVMSAARAQIEVAVPRSLAVARWCQGLSEEDPAAVGEAVDHFRVSGRRLELGQALEDMAVLRARWGQTAPARAALAEALAVYGELKAVWDARRMRSRLLQYGVRSATRVARRPSGGWLALTATELKVAGLVAEGKSNPEIAAALHLSRRTVETHVSHVLAKLGIRSRRDVMARYADHGDAVN